ncbi:MAG TPA: M23 family metallopeptidase, partial [Chloroflexota bacterium]|nr:M23 family metallopeptidase [Chloroflexota bacterium]
VSKGQLVGRIGSTGRSTGPHLHFEIEYGGFLNPLSVLR